jgi:hypothetical protein
MIGSRNRVSCRNLFRRLEILPLASQYIVSLRLYVVNNKNLSILNWENHNTSTRQSNHFYQPIANYTVYQKRVYCMGIRIYNNLPLHIKNVSHNPRKLKIYLKHFLHIHYFYSIEAYFQYKAITSQ